jgi:endo-1,4-beta-xylanase
MTSLRRVLSAAAALLLACLASPARAALPPGTPAIDPNPAKLAVNGAEQRLLPVTGQPFGQALRLSINQQHPNAWNAQLRAPITTTVKRGDVLYLTFHLRAISTRAESGEVYANAIFERSSPPHNKALQVRCGAGREWTQYQLPFVSDGDYAPGQAAAALHLGLGVQTLEVADFSLLNYGTSVKLGDLPRTKFTYAGREPDAPWRKAAAERIDRHRKADLTVRLTDAAGRPVSGADVRVRMTRHAFPFGSAVAADLLLRDSAEGARYRDEVVRLFNRVVLENDLKWPQWEQNRDRAKKAVDWLRSKNIEIRGHNLVWPGERYLPRNVLALRNDRDALRRRIDDHILDEAAALAGKVVEWDVINEPYTNRLLQDVLGNEEMTHWFKLARQADPTAVLFLNDYPILTGQSDPHFDGFEKALSFLKDGGAPLGGIGVQGHYGATLPPVTQILAGLDRLAKFNLPIAITELDIDTTDEQLQADYLRDHTIACFSHPSVNQVIMWGFWEGRHWKPVAAPYRRDWSRKPAAQAWEDLIFKQWWTDGTAKTGPDGRLTLRAFQGDYEITAPGLPPIKAKLGPTGATIDLRPADARSFSPA